MSVDIYGWIEISRYEVWEPVVNLQYLLPSSHSAHVALWGIGWGAYGGIPLDAGLGRLATVSDFAEATADHCRSECGEELRIATHEEVDTFDLGRHVSRPPSEAAPWHSEAIRLAEQTRRSMLGDAASRFELCQDITRLLVQNRIHDDVRWCVWLK